VDLEQRSIILLRMFFIFCCLTASSHFNVCFRFAQLQYVPSFYNNSLIFLEVTCGVLGFQALFGTFFVIYYGLCTATREAGSHLVTRDADDREPLVVHH
jgi:hypothetical protein